MKSIYRFIINKPQADLFIILKNHSKMTIEKLVKQTGYNYAYLTRVLKIYYEEKLIVKNHKEDWKTMLEISLTAKGVKIAKAFEELKREVEEDGTAEESSAIQGADE